MPILGGLDMELTELGSEISQAQSELHNLPVMCITDIPTTAKYVFLGRKLIQQEAERINAVPLGELRAYMKESPKLFLSLYIDRNVGTPGFRHGSVKGVVILTDEDVILPDTHTAFGIGFGLVKDIDDTIWNLSLLKTARGRKENNDAL